MDRYIKNVSGGILKRFGVWIDADEYFKIDHDKFSLFLNCQTIANDIDNEDIEASSNGTSTISDKDMGKAYLYSQYTETDYFFYPDLKTITNSTDNGCPGFMCADANYIYFCTAVDTWKRAALSSW